MELKNSVPEPLNNPIIRFISDPKYRWLRHTLFILLGLILGFKGDIGVADEHRAPELVKALLIVDAITFVFIMAEIYFLLLFLIPKLLFRSKVFLFSLSFFVLISLIYFVAWYVDLVFLRPFDRGPVPAVQHVELSLIAYIQLIAVAAVLLGSVVGLAIFKKWINDVNHFNALHQANLRTELEQLKSQVNPHFLFNTLNNLLVLTQTDPEKATQVLLGLSDLLRYQLYDSAREKILLSKDIEFIHNLLSLEKIRKNDFDYFIETRGNPEFVTLSPFLFIPFVENAIKHGASSVGHSFLRLSFIIGNGRLNFTSENSIPPVRKDSIGGLGLVNVKRRLELLYPGKHELNIRDDSNTYTVNLSLPI
ncbi:MAG: histidine kinase [Chitinophagaceae bacterium]|nr:MAG: histidine kinase [Chitinophagaceae bacterium]